MSRRARRWLIAAPPGTATASASGAICAASRPTSSAVLSPSSRDMAAASAAHWFLFVIPTTLIPAASRYRMIASLTASAQRLPIASPSRSRCFMAAMRASRGASAGTPVLAFVSRSKSMTRARPNTAETGAPPKMMTCAFSRASISTQLQ